MKIVEKYFDEDEQGIAEYSYDYPNTLELIDVFKDTLPQICEEKIKAGEQTDKFLRLKSLLQPDGMNKADNWNKKFERAKEVSILDLYKFEKLRRTARSWEALCCFHPDKRPSLSIFKDGTGGFKCWSCGKWGGDAVDFIKELYSVDTRKAVNLLTEGGTLERQNKVLSQA